MNFEILILLSLNFVLLIYIFQFVKHFIKSKYLPSMELGFYIFLSIIMNSIRLSVFFFGIDKKISSVVNIFALIFMSHLMVNFVYSFAASNKKFLKYFFLVCLAIYVGYFITLLNLIQLKSEYMFNGYFYSLIMLSFLICIHYCIVVYQKIEKSYENQKRTNLLFIYGLIIAIFVIIFSFLISIKFLIWFLNVGILIYGYIYIKNPYKMYISQYKIHSAYIFDMKSGMSLVEISCKPNYSQTLFGSIILQKNILNTNLFPVKYDLNDKEMIFERINISSNTIIGVLIVDRSIPLFRVSLKNMLSKFRKSCGNYYINEPENIMNYEEYKKKITKHLSFALIDNDMSSNKTKTKNKLKLKLKI